MLENKLRKYISELIKEVEEELEEQTTTANIDGYQTPYTFLVKEKRIGEKRLLNKWDIKLLIEGKIKKKDELIDG